MNPTKDQIKTWLSHPDRSREWLAGACGVSKNTVNNWLSTSIQIPQKKLVLISKMMNEPESALEQQDHVEPIIVIKTTREENEKWQRAALLDGMTLSDWIIHVIESACKNEMTLASSYSQVIDNETLVGGGGEMIDIYDSYPIATDGHTF